MSPTLIITKICFCKIKGKKKVIFWKKLQINNNLKFSFITKTNSKGKGTLRLFNYSYSYKKEKENIWYSLLDGPWQVLLTAITKRIKTNIVHAENRSNLKSKYTNSLLKGIIIQPIPFRQRQRKKKVAKNSKVSAATNKQRLHFVTYFKSVTTVGVRC